MSCPCHHVKYRESYANYRLNPWDWKLFPVRISNSKICSMMQGQRKNLFMNYYLRKRLWYKMKDILSAANGSKSHVKFLGFSFIFPMSFCLASCTSVAFV